MTETSLPQPTAPSPIAQAPLQSAPEPVAKAPDTQTPLLVAPEDRPQPEQLILEWIAPNRPFKQRKQKYYVTIGMILFLICLILFFAGQFILIAVGIAAAFLYYVLSAIPPEHVQNQITTYGVRTDNQLYYWDEMGRFWYKNKHQQRVLHIEVNRFPNHLTLLLGDLKEEELTEILSQVLLNEEPLPTGFDKAATWLQDKIQLDPEA